MSDGAPTSTSTNSHDRGLLVVISGPSGAGKTTIARRVERQLGAHFSVSATTRPKTPADVEGRDYFFITEPDFKSRVARGEMLEHAQVFGTHWYGTPRAAVEQSLSAGRLVILEIDVQGGLQVRRSMPEAFLIFIEPPDEHELLRRLRERRREDEPTIQRRFAEARREIEVARASGDYDVFVVNADLDDASAAVCRAIEQRRRSAPARPR